jgi:hypothetical protein
MTTQNSKQSRKAADSGVLSFDGRIVSYTSQHYGSFSLPLAEVGVIGEFTTDNGPFIDDWFLVFVPRDGRDFFEASMDAEHSNEVRMQLAGALGGELSTNLVFSTDFRSRVLWPPALVGKPLYTFADELSEATGFWERLRLRFSQRVIHRLSQDVLHYLTHVA